MNSKKIKDTLGSTGTILSRKKIISDEFFALICKNLWILYLSFKRYFLGFILDSNLFIAYSVKIL